LENTEDSKDNKDNKSKHETDGKKGFTISEEKFLLEEVYGLIVISKEA